MKMRATSIVFASLMWISTMLAGISPAAAADMKPADTKPVDTPTAEQLTAEWEAKLDGSEWTIQLSPATGTGKPQTDTLKFERGTITSKWCSKEGFAASNYTLSAQDAGHAEWQTNQSNPDGHVASWRGEISGNAMSGALNKRTPDGHAMVFYVNGTKVASAPPPPPPPKPEPPQPPAAITAPTPALPPAAAQNTATPSSQPQAPTSPPQEKKKWGWW